MTDAAKTLTTIPRLTDVKPGFVCRLGSSVVEVVEEWRYSRGEYSVDVVVAETGERRNHVLLTSLSLA